METSASSDMRPDETHAELPAAEARDGEREDEREDEREVLGNDVVGAAPPGYDWPTHGGYLGCFVATLAACMLAGFLSANLLSFLYIALRWPLAVYALVTIAVFVVLLVGLGRLGWVLGKRFYRYYPQPRPTWGESDAVADVRKRVTAVAGQNAAEGGAPATEGETGSAEGRGVATGNAESVGEPIADARASGTPATQ
jgi:hypothetical protein